jgi:selenide,water dikinase
MGMGGNAAPVLRDIVLVGGGHSHVGVLRRFGMRPEPGVRLTVICTTTDTPYSGMLPGYVAGHYGFDDVHIDLSRLAVFAGARFFRDEVIGLDRATGIVLCRNRPPVPYDVCSINIGSTPQMHRVPGASAHAIPVKPIQQFNDRWLALLDRVRSRPGPVTIAVVGGGAGGVELVLAMQWRLRREREARARSPEGLRFHLFAASAEVMPTHNAWVRRQFARVLAERGVQLHASAKVAEVLDGRVVTSGGETVPVDEVVWVTQAGGASWLRDTGLAVDDDGFLIVDDHLCCLGDERVFAAGDIASMRSRPLEKAGVFAVRMGVPLADNLRRALRGEPLRAYRPQRHWLALISTGGRHAVASRGPIGFAGDWVWRWKDGIDRRFMRRFSAFPVMAEAPPAAPPAVALTDAESTQAISALAMRCGGCGAKVGATVLSRALSNLQPLQREDVVVGLDSPDDAAVVRVPPGKAMVHTVDFFRAFIDDPYRFGRIAANHALGDLFAMGAEPQTAAAIVTVPPGLESKVEDVLFQMMRGAVDVLDAAGCALVGGHTGEGAELALGFSLHGLLDDRPDAAMRKGGLVAGDALILTKPIGTGTLFAAHPRGLAKGRWIDAALVSMEQSSRDAARILREHGARGCTDVTGFGLLGHLVEMTRASGVDAELTLSALPVLDGAEDCVASGVTSSLQPANVRLRRALRNQAAYAAHPRYPLLFDPQTAGGLLAGVPADVAQDCIARLRESGYLHAAVIGRIAPPGDAMEPITLVD